MLHEKKFNEVQNLSLCEIENIYFNCFCEKFKLEKVSINVQL